MPPGEDAGHELLQDEVFSPDDGRQAVDQAPRKCMCALEIQSRRVRRTGSTPIADSRVSHLPECTTLPQEGIVQEKGGLKVLREPTQSLQVVRERESDELSNDVLLRVPHASFREEPGDPQPLLQDWKNAALHRA